MGSRVGGGVLTLLLVYFAYHAFAGETGLGRWSDMQREEARLTAELEHILDDIRTLETELAMLQSGQVDRDHVEALAREKLAFAYADEIILSK